MESMEIISGGTILIFLDKFSHKTIMQHRSKGE